MSFRVEEKCILKNIDKNKFKSTLFKIGGKILFPKSYPYTSSTTKILRENFNYKKYYLKL